MYLCYDVRGIQQFIFSVPKLKYVIGASQLIYQFDSEIAPRQGKDLGAARLFSGGGKGAFRCDGGEERAKKLRDRLVAEAHKIGLDLRIGMHEKLSDAATKADELYPYCPESLEGEPCAASGLWPVTEANGKGREEEGGYVDALVWDRRERARKDLLGQEQLGELEKRGGLPDGRSAAEFSFLRAVREQADDDKRTGENARAGDEALGGRNRWAIIAMDGNDMGSQHRAFADMKRSDDEQSNWLTAMSRALDECTRESFYEALKHVVGAWWKSGRDRAEIILKDDKTKRIVIPFRPLILGGDDVLCLCHCSYALDFVESMCAAFNRISKEKAQAARKEKGIEQLWPATGNELTISAGVVFCGVTYPLHTAIPYAESLLASAKGKFRRKPDDKSKTPTPAAVDWENITDNLLDTPAARRARALHFEDGELGRKVVLTRRPYRIESLRGLRKLAETMSKNLPTSLLADVLPNLYRPWSERVCWLAGLERASRNATLVKHLDERDPDKLPAMGDDFQEGWVRAENVQSTAVPDAILLIEEEHRMTQRTSGQ